MASYDLRCGGCGRQFEVFVQGFLKERDRVCPDCGGTDVQQLFTGFMMGSVGASDPVCASAPAGGCGASHGFG